MAAEVSDGWAEVELWAIAEAVMGQSPPGKTVLDWDGKPREDVGLPFIQGNAEFGSKFPLPVKWCVAPVKVAHPGDTLISVRAPVGETNRADCLLAIGRGLAAIRFTKADPSFGWHALNRAKEAFERVAQGSTFDAIGGKEIRGLRLLLPPLTDQRAIADVLDAIDDAIERTEAVIEATEALRKALLHELLTRGVPGWHTEWQHVPGIGTIPACWEVVRLGECGDWLSGGTPSKIRPDYWAGDLPWVSPKDMKRRELCDAIDRVTEAGARAGSRIVEPGTIFVVVRGMILAHSFPVAITRVRCAFNQDIKALVCSGGMTPDFLLAVLESRKDQLLELPTPSTHGTMRVITDELQALPVPKPSPGEQQQIVGLVSALALRTATEEQHVAALSATKTIVADALLSGRMRVPTVGEVAQ